MTHESLEQTARYWVGQDKQERYIWKGTSKRLSLTRERGHDGRIHEVPQEDSRSSLMTTWLCQEIVMNYLRYIVHAWLCCYNYSCLLLFLYWLVLIFLQVKNKPWLPWVYSWIRHRREQVWRWINVPWNWFFVHCHGKWYQLYLKDPSKMKWKDIFHYFEPLTQLVF